MVEYVTGIPITPVVLATAVGATPWIVTDPSGEMRELGNIVFIVAIEGLDLQGERRVCTVVLPSDGLGQADGLNGCSRSDYRSHACDSRETNAGSETTSMHGLLDRLP